MRCAATLGALLLIAGAGVSAQERPVVETPAPIVWIAAGSFLRGSDERAILFAKAQCYLEIQPELRGLCDVWIDAEGPQRVVHTAAYGIDRTEVTQAVYRRCVRDGACRPSRLSDADPRIAGDDLPVVGVTFADARALCAYAGGRLPTEAEWERAARGADGRAFPWGWRWNPHLANHAEHVDPARSRLAIEPDGVAHLAPVGSFPAGASPYGLLDTAGNVREWTADTWSEDYAALPTIDPLATDGARRIARGGSWGSTALRLRAAARVDLAEDTADAETGLRCAYDR